MDPALRFTAVLIAAALAWGCPRPGAIPAPPSPSEPSESHDADEPRAAPEAPVPETPVPSEDTPPLPPPEDELLAAELATVGWDGLTGAPVVLLRELASGQVLPIWIGVAEARAIALELHSIEPPRPMTHDLMANLLTSLAATLEEVVVTDLRDNTYYGLLKLRRDGTDEPLWVDTRPSDGLALAVRTGAEIRVARKLLEEVGKGSDFQFLAPDSADQVVRLLGMTVRACRPDEEGDGLVVIAVTGKAERAGLAAGDRITEVNGEAVDEPVDLLDAVRDIPPTGVLRIKYQRGDDEDTVELPLEVAPPKPSPDDVVA